jgi:hypothetical protein
MTYSERETVRQDKMKVTQGHEGTPTETRNNLSGGAQALAIRHEPDEDLRMEGGRIPKACESALCHNKG